MLWQILPECCGLEDGSVVTWVSVPRDELSLYGSCLRRDVGILYFVMSCRCTEGDSFGVGGSPRRDGLPMAIVAPFCVGICTSRRVDGSCIGFFVGLSLCFSGRRACLVCCVPLAGVPVLYLCSFGRRACLVCALCVRIRMLVWFSLHLGSSGSSMQSAKIVE